MRRLIALAILLSVASTAEAGKCYRTTQTLKSYSGWNHSCYSCHKTQQAQSKPADAYGWRAYLLNIAKQREEHQTFLREAAALGLTNYVKGGGYGQVSQYTEQTYTQPSAQYGTTLYGYATANQVLGNLDNAAVFNHAARLTDQAQQLAGSGFQAFMDTLQLDASNRASVAKILAQGQAASQALQASRVQEQGQQTSRTFTFQLQQSPEGQVTVQTVPQQPTGGQAQFNEALFAQVANQRCAACHTDATEGGPKAGLNVRNLMALDDRGWDKVLARINSMDPEKRMPKDAEPLPWAERDLFSQGAQWSLRNSGQFRTQEQPQPPPNPQPPSNY